MNRIVTYPNFEHNYPDSKGNAVTGTEVGEKNAMDVNQVLGPLGFNFEYWIETNTTTTTLNEFYTGGDTVNRTGGTLVGEVFIEYTDSTKAVVLSGYKRKIGS